MNKASSFLTAHTQNQLYTYNAENGNAEFYA
jgi:hypothetical protein